MSAPAWLPIEQAPRDGTLLLLAQQDPDYPLHGEEGRWYQFTGWFKHGDWYCAEYDAFEKNPSHFKFLGPDPTDDRETSKAGEVTGFTGGGTMPPIHMDCSIHEGPGNLSLEPRDYVPDPSHLADAFAYMAHGFGLQARPNEATAMSECMRRTAPTIGEAFKGTGIDAMWLDENPDGSSPFKGSGP